MGGLHDEGAWVGHARAARLGKQADVLSFFGIFQKPGAFFGRCMLGDLVKGEFAEGFYRIGLPDEPPGSLGALGDENVQSVEDVDDILGKSMCYAFAQGSGDEIEFAFCYHRANLGYNRYFCKKQPMEGEGAKKYYSISDYLELEAHSEEKHEFRDGIIVAMSGGTISHNMICGNVFYALRVEKEKGCTVFNSDQRIYFDKLNHYVYPDISVVCGDIEVSDKDENAVINPVLIIEVLSDNTAAYDRGEKFRKYRSLPSFKEYILIDQEQPIVDTLFREDGKYWRMQTIIGLGKMVPVYSLNIEIRMEDIYAEISGLKEPQIKLDL